MSGKIFDLVKVETPDRNMFDFTHDHKTTTDMGRLTPVCVMECLPGDRVTLGSQALVRFAPMIAPVMHKFDVRIEYFFCPNRLVWSNWMKFISSDPSNLGALPAVPYITVGASNHSESARNKMLDYMGIPPCPDLNPNTEKISALPLAAMQMIYDFYYRDQNLIPSVPAGYTLIDGDNTANFAAICNTNYRAWEHDYFTSCLPFAQKGNPVSIGTTTYNDVAVKKNTADPGTDFYVSGTVGSGGPTDYAPIDITPTDNPGGLPANGLYADTSELEALSLTINDLREAEALQKWLEKNARGGTRPDEVIKAHFGVDMGDARLIKPEYIVGVKQNVMVSEVLNTAGFQEDPGTGEPIGNAQGTMAGHGVSMVDDENYGSYFCREHGFIIGILSIMPKTSYQQGLEKFWLKTTDPTQYYWPEFAHIGEQPVLNKEIAAYQGGAGDGTFGYLPAYQDYRFKSSVVTGDFKSQLAYWHCGRIFSAPPALNGAFITANNVRKDIFAVVEPDIDSLYVHVSNKVFASRLLPVFGIPSL